MRIVISGVGIAGPTLAYWLRHHDVLFVEAAPELRRGGYIIDFWGLGYDIAEKMGVLPAIAASGYQVREVRFVGRDGRKTGGFGTAVFDRLTNGRFTSLRRSDLAAALYAAIGGRVETIFGDSIASIEDAGDRVHLTFTRGGGRDADLVIGADGLHSRVRELVFGPQDQFEIPLGYHVAAAEVDGYRPRDELVYVTFGAPGRQVSRFSMRNDKTLFLFVFRDEYLPHALPVEPGERHSALRHVYAHLGWECPRILAAIADTPDLYFDRVSQIRMDRWSHGRTVLAGDAAACVSLLAGEGSGLAMAEAYVLANALDTCAGDYADAFARYERLLRAFVLRKQEAALRFASAFAPRTALGVSIRNLVTHLLRVPFVADYFIGRDLRDDITLPGAVSTNE